MYAIQHKTTAQLPDHVIGTWLKMYLYRIDFCFLTVHFNWLSVVFSLLPILAFQLTKQFPTSAFHYLRSCFHRWPPVESCAFFSVVLYNKYCHCSMFIHWLFDGLSSVDAHLIIMIIITFGADIVKRLNDVLFDVKRLC